MKTPPTCHGCRQPLPENAPEGLCPACLAKTALADQTSPSGATINVTPLAEAAPGATVALTEVHFLPDHSPRAALAAGKPFGGYRILRPLGEGGMGAVYEAEEIESGRRLALKVLTHALDSQQARQRFFREGRLAASVNHPNSVYVFGTEEVDGLPVITMELVAGGTLQERVKQQGPMAVAEAVDAVLQVVAGLEAAAAAGVLHRDVKPSNCFIELDGTIKVGDFGLSITTIRDETRLTMTGAVLGTPAFASPEQLRGDEMTVRSDIYSVGVTLYYLLTGRVPFEGDNLMRLLATVLERPAESPAKWRKDIPRELCQVVLRCLEKQSAARYKDYAELRAALRPYSSAEPTPGALGRRVVASILDSLLISLVAFPAAFLLRDVSFSALKPPQLGEGMVSWSFCILSSLGTLLYYGVLDGVWGATVGKRLCGLRVVGRNRSSPGVPRALLRAFIIEILPALPFLLLSYLGGLQEPSHLGGIKALGLADTNLLVVAALFCTARRRNGFAAVHDLLTRTRVIVKSANPVRPRLAADERVDTASEAASMIGPYGILEALDRTESVELLVGFDARLLRKVWIRRLPAGAPPIAPNLRTLARAGRLRWLSGRRSREECWDAYEAVTGKPLLNLIHERQPWGQVRFWLLDLAEEMAAALKDRSLPEALALDRVWITAEGRAKLLDFPAPGLDRRPENAGDGSRPLPGAGAAEGASAEAMGAREATPPQTDLHTAQEFLRQVAVAALEGRIIAAGAAHPGAIPLPLPLHAREVLAELETGLAPNLVADRLKPLLDRVASVSRRRRAGLVAGCSAVALIGTSAAIAVFATFEQSSRKHPELIALQAGLQQAMSWNMVWNSTPGSPSGLDWGGAAYSGNLLGSSLTWEGTVFKLGPTNAPDAVAGSGQRIPLPAGKFAALRLLATGVNGPQLHQPFTVTYTDKSSQTFTQDLSDWCKPKDHPGESQALVMAHRTTGYGTNENLECCLYGYAFGLDTNKSVNTLTLPTNSGVMVVAASLGAPATPVDLSPFFNVPDGIAADGASFSLAPHLRKAYETCIRGRFGQTITNPATWSTMVGALMTMQGQKEQAERLLASQPQPTETELEQATALLDLRQRGNLLTSPAGPVSASTWVEPRSLRIMLSIFCSVLVGYSAVPALIAALLFRGGLVLRSLGVAVVRKDGTQASRWRIFWRGILAWAPFVGLTLVSFPGPWLAHGAWGWLVPAAAFAICSVLTVWSLWLPERSLQDRLAGTALVPR